METEQVVFTNSTDFITHLEATPEGLITHAEVAEILKSFIPVKLTNSRGMLAGIAVADMTIEQLKREKINAGSVLYKATQRGAAADTIAKNQARFDTVIAEIVKRTPAPVPAEPATQAPIAAMPGEETQEVNQEAAVAQDHPVAAEL